MKDTTKLKVENYITKVNNHLLSYLSGKPLELYQASTHYLKSGGKRLRPIMVIKSCEMFGGNQQDALAAATAVEFIHNFSLVHDDIMDNDDQRHGIQTVHKSFGLPLAILSGDILFSKAFQILSTTTVNSIKDSSLLSMIRKLSSACVDICEGQAKDIQFSQRQNFPSEDEYMDMISKKTAALFNVSCSLGALSSRNATERDVNNMSDFGKNSGIAFQLIDDLIGIAGHSNHTGKAVGNDIREGKKTYPILLSIKKASELERSHILKVFGKTQCDTSSLKKAIDVISSLQIEEIVRKKAMDYSEKARKALANYEDSDPKKILQELSNYIVERSK
ncbi:MAG TPA: polyprenyl synthetase family protein [Nitrososphaeraceae archaeon]|nr:polyprenyl synthetase family protein [Nitrososphaeraceae archaeon]